MYCRDCSTGSIKLSSTDASSVIQTTINMTESGVIYIKDGDYPIDRTISIDTKSNIKLWLSQNARLYRSKNQSYHLLMINNSSGIEISGGYIDGVFNDTMEGLNEYKSNSIRIQNSSKITINGVYLYNPSDDGVYIIASSGVRVINCFVVKFFKHAIDVVSTSLADTSKDVIIANNIVDAENNNIFDGITVYAYSPEVVIIGNTVRNVYNTSYETDQSGIHVEDPSPSPDNDVITVVGNTVDSCKFGITTATARPVVIADNSIFNCVNRGIFLFNPKYNIVKSNSIQKCPVGIYIVGGVYTIIDGNIINKCTSHGIQQYAPEGGLMQFSKVLGNIISDINEDGIHIMDSEGVDVSHNMLRNIGKNGIVFERAIRSNIQNNEIYDASASANNTYDGIRILGTEAAMSYWNRIISNYFRNDGPNMTRYHLYLAPYVGHCVVAHNMFDDGGVSGKLYSYEISNIIFNNRGYVTENSGTATIPAGSTYVDVSHGLNITPEISRIVVTPLDNLGGKNFWISNVTNTTFRINISSADTVDHSFAWSYK